MMPSCVKETQQWLSQLRRDMEIKPEDELFQHLRGNSKREDLTVPIVNNARQLIQQVFPNRGGYMDATGPHILGGRLASDIGVYALYLYYRLLLVAIQEGHDMGCSKESYLWNMNFHNGLVCCSLEVVTRAFVEEVGFPWATSRAGRQAYMMDFWHAVRVFISCFPTQPMPPPASLLEYLSSLQDQVLDWRAFSKDSSFYVYASDGGGGFWGSGDKTLVAIFLQEAAFRAMESTISMAQWWCNTTTELQGKQEDFTSDCASIMDEALFKHLHLLFGRSIPALVACCAGKVYNVQMNMADAQRGVLQIFLTQSSNTINNVEIMCNKDSIRQNGNLRTFYNTIFLPLLRGYLDEMDKDHQLGSQQCDFTPTQSIESIER